MPASKDPTRTGCAPCRTHPCAPCRTHPCAPNGADSPCGAVPRGFPRRFLRRDRRGATTLEFAVVSLPFIVVVIGIVEIAWQYTTATLLDAAALRASRFGTLGANTPATRPEALPETVVCRTAYIPWFITHTSNGVLRPNRLRVDAYSAQSVSTFAVTQPPAPPQQGNQGQPGAFGRGGEIVRYTITYTQPFMLLPWTQRVGLPSELTHRAVITVKNEPFSNASC